MAARRVAEMPRELKEGLISFGDGVEELNEMTADMSRFRNRIRMKEWQLRRNDLPDRLRTSIHNSIAVIEYCLNRRAVVAEMYRQHLERQVDHLNNLVDASPLADRPDAVRCRSLQDIEAVKVLTEYIVSWDYAVRIAIEYSDVYRDNINTINNNNNINDLPARVLIELAEERGFRVQRV